MRESDTSDHEQRRGRNTGLRGLSLIYRLRTVLPNSQNSDSRLSALLSALILGRLAGDGEVSRASRGLLIVLHSRM